MPRYTIRDPQSGKTMTVEGSSPPTEQELESLFAKYTRGPQTPPSPPLGLYGISVDPASQGQMAEGARRGAKIFGQAAVDAAPAIGGSIGAVMGGPPGALAGASGGSLVKQMINAATGQTTQPVSPLGAAGDVAKDAALYGGPEVVGAGATAVGKRAAPWLMNKALKPSMALLEEYRTTAPELAKTLLTEGVNVTRGGLERLQALFGENNQAIAQAVKHAPGTIDKPIVASRAVETAGKLAKQTNPTADLKAVGDTVEEFLKHPVYQGALTVPEAQAMKVGTYQQIGKKYGEVSSAGIETQKALARGLKEEVAAKVPGIDALNQRDSRLMAGIDAVGRRVAIADNKDPVGFAWTALHRPESFIAALVDRSEAVKSLIARGAWAAAGRSAGVPSHLIRTAVAAIAAGGTDEATPPADGSPVPASGGR